MSYGSLQSENQSNAEIDDALLELRARLHTQDPVLLESKLINRAELRQIYPASDMTIWRLERKGLFPKHIKICGRNFWRLVEVLSALSRLSEVKNDASAAQ